MTFDVFFMNAESFREGEQAPFFTAYMLYEDAQSMDMGFTMEMTDDETRESATMKAGFAMKGPDMKMYFDMGGMYCGLNIGIGISTWAACTVASTSALRAAT